MTVSDDLATVVDLACLTEDRTPAEQKALRAIALRVDKDRNRQSSSNGLLDRRALASIRFPYGGPPTGPACTYSETHDKKRCVCRGQLVAVEPRGGWSRRVAEVVASWHDSQAAEPKRPNAARADAPLFAETAS